MSEPTYRITVTLGKGSFPYNSVSFRIQGVTRMIEQVIGLASELKPGQSIKIELDWSEYCAEAAE